MIRVLVVDDSAFSRVTIARMIGRDPELTVVGTAVNGEEAIRLAVSRAPEVLTLDLEMPGLDGYSVLRWLAANRPIPAIVVSSRQGQNDVFKALELGAIDFVLKPQAHASTEYARLEATLPAKIRAAAASRRLAAGERWPSPGPRHAVEAGSRERATAIGATNGLLAIGASTGGPAALTAIFEALPPLDAAVVVAQHMPAGFTGLFAERLARVARMPVCEAHDGQRVQGGRAYIAPGGHHMEIAGEFPRLRARVFPRGDDDLYSPGVDRLFRSAAQAAGRAVLAVVLTGMGSDGRDGVVAVRRAGGRTLAESEESAVVFGMPREAALTGSIDEVHALSDLPASIVRLLSRAAASGPG
jgi:two-component system, chemotaxis family, protein-glutamate methylesterase/glutaminase